MVVIVFCFSATNHQFAFYANSASSRFCRISFESLILLREAKVTTVKPELLYADEVIKSSS